MTTYVPRTPPPLPTAPVPIRPVERRPSPFADVRAPRPQTERQRIKAVREARRILDDLDARRNGVVREEHLAARRVARTKAKPKSTEPKLRRKPTTAVLPDEQLLAYFDQGLSCLQIQRLTGINQRTIRSRAHAIGVHEFPTTRAKGGVRKDITADTIRPLREQGMSWRAIADHFGVSYVTIRRYRDRAGINPTEKGSTAA